MGIFIFIFIFIFPFLSCLLGGGWLFARDDELGVVLQLLSFVCFDRSKERVLQLSNLFTVLSLTHSLS